MTDDRQPIDEYRGEVPPMPEPVSVTVTIISINNVTHEGRPDAATDPYEVGTP